jgi:hypothetical protein
MIFFFFTSLLHKMISYFFFLIYITSITLTTIKTKISQHNFLPNHSTSVTPLFMTLFFLKVS